MKQILSALESLITVALVFIGIAGMAYHGFREGGWVERGFGKITDAYVNYPLIALATTVALFFAIRAWRRRKIRSGRSKMFDYMVYALMAVGIYFIGHYIITGEF